MSIDVKPIKGIIYNSEKVDINKVIAPPYDVISNDYRKLLYKRSEYNIVNLILPEGGRGLKSKNNCYKIAAQKANDWLEKDILIKLDKPVIFYILQKYKYKNKEIIRKGFIAKNKIEDFSTKNILPHEYTMPGPKKDRLNLVKACKKSFSQIFLVYSDPEYIIERSIAIKKKTPLFDITDDNGVRNIVYMIDDKKIISTIQKVLSNKTCLIADGHHRYETALNYRNYIRKISGKASAGYAEYVMSYFTNLEDNLVIYPTHRVITKKLSNSEILNASKKYFNIQEFEFNPQNKTKIKNEFIKIINKNSKNEISMGLYLKGKNKFYILKLKENVDKILDEYKVPEVLKDLDLTVLHKIILEKELKYTQEDLINQNGIIYIKKEEEAFDKVENGEAEALFIMANPKIKDVQKISEARCRMPQKSTYFYPKLLSGIVINPLKS